MLQLFLLSVRFHFFPHVVNIIICSTGGTSNTRDKGSKSGCETQQIADGIGNSRKLYIHTDRLRRGDGRCSFSLESHMISSSGMFFVFPCSRSAWRWASSLNRIQFPFFYFCIFDLFENSLSINKGVNATPFGYVFATLCDALSFAVYRPMYLCVNC